MGIQPVMAQEVYVAAEGSDLNPGTATRPVATLEKARDLLRARQSKAGGAVVHVQPGIYLRTAPFLLSIDNRGVSRGYNQNNRHLMAGLKAVDYQSPPWSTRYPELVNILNDNPAYPKGNKLVGNVLIGSKVSQTGSAKSYEGSTIANNPVKTRQDAGLPKTGNPIPALRKRETITFPDVSGFEPIPIGKIGLYKDEFRKSLPAVE
jgi:hypothetical protein